MKDGINMIVCVKQVSDPDGPPSAFEVDSDKKSVIPKGIPPVINPYDENALEAALRMKEICGGKITVLSIGRKLAKNVLIKALAAGADELIMFQDDSFDGLDGYFTAHGLAAAIRKVGDFDLILCGRQAADSNSGLVGVGVAEILNIPSVSFVQRLEVLEESLRVERTVPDGYVILDLPTPALVVISGEIYTLRYTSIPDLMAAKKKPIRVWNAGDVELNLENKKRMNLVSLSPRVSKNSCEIIEGTTLDEVGTNLARKLVAVGAIQHSGE